MIAKDSRNVRASGRDPLSGVCKGATNTANLLRARLFGHKGLSFLPAEGLREKEKDERISHFGTPYRVVCAIFCLYTLCALSQCTARYCLFSMFLGHLDSHSFALSCVFFFCFFLFLLLLLFYGEDCPSRDV